jgi:hypothetical protein
MRRDQLEAWVLKIVDIVSAGGGVEDSRVELKADWPEPKEAARKIGGHANAAGSDSILWVVGLDEKKGVTPIKPVEPANWLPQVAAEFDGLAPSLLELMVVPTPPGSVVALLFDASRRPFVVKHPKFGRPDGGNVSLEVPWRRDTGTHSARRDELLRILVPRQALPSVELLTASATVNIRDPLQPGWGRQPSDIRLSEHLVWSFYLTLYVTPQTTDLLVLPTHKARFSFALGSDRPLIAVEFRFSAPYRTVSTIESVLDSSTVTASAGEAVFRGPGLLNARAEHYEVVRSLPPDADLAATLAVSPAGSDLKSEIGFRLLARGEQAEYRRSWDSEQ